MYTCTVQNQFLRVIYSKVECTPVLYRTGNYEYSTVQISVQLYCTEPIINLLLCQDAPGLLMERHKAATLEKVFLDLCIATE